METQVKRTRRTKAQMEEFRKQQKAEREFPEPKKVKVRPLEDDDFIEDEPEEATMLKASFIISNGARECRIVAEKNCWALQEPKTWVDKKTGKTLSGWTSRKWFNDLGLLASYIYMYRVKNADISTLIEFAETSKKIAEDIRREFSVLL